MKENKKATKVIGFKSSKQKQENEPGQNSNKKSNKATQKPIEAAEGTKEKRGREKESVDNDNQHDYQVPVGEQNRPNKKHSQSETMSNENKNRSSSQGFNTNKKQSK